MPSDPRSGSGISPARAKQDLEAKAQEDQYSAFTTTEKRCIVSMASLACWISNLSTFIYLPVLPALSEAFAVSAGQINLTITVYMVVAAVAPTLVGDGDAADVLGRRVAYAFSLGLFLVACVCLGCAASYGQLLGFRVLQALGQSGIIVIGYGVVADIASPAERGSYMSVASFAVTVGPCLGPVLGGSLAHAAGWAWIFWFLVIVSAPCLLLMVFCLPETSRNVVGNGSIPPAKYLRLPLAPKQFMKHWKGEEGGRETNRRVPNPLRSLGVLRRKDNMVVVLAWGLMYAVYSSIIFSTSTLFERVYSLSEWQLGLIYLPFAVGGTVSTFCSGWILDRTYRKARTRRGLSADGCSGRDALDLAIEKTRIRAMAVPMAAIMFCVFGYGWTLQRRKHVAFPLALQFVLGFNLRLNFTGFNTLLVDINPQCPAAANASTSIIRCALSAIVIAVLDDVFDVVGIGYAFMVIGGFCVAVLALFLVEYRCGMAWRNGTLGNTAEK